MTKLEPETGDLADSLHAYAIAQWPYLGTQTTVGGPLTTVGRPLTIIVGSYHMTRELVPIVT